MKLLRPFKVLFNRTLLVILTIVIIVIVQLQYRKPSNTITVPATEPKVIQLDEQRREFKNPIYSKWQTKSRKPAGLEKQCHDYFKEWAKLSPGPQETTWESFGSFPFDKTLYRQSTWFKQAEKQLRRHLKHQGEYFVPRHKHQLINDFNTKLSALVQYEDALVQDINHVRIFGKCMDQLTNQNQCMKILNRLFPWITGKEPVFTRWDHSEAFPRYISKPIQNTGCFLQDFARKSNGKGIVVPVIPNANHVNRILRMIKVLRGLKNQLPIQFMYKGNMFDNKDVERIIDAARSEFKSINSATNTENREFPKQDIWFVDMSDVVDNNFHAATTITSLMMTSLLFNSFEDVVFLTTSVVPMLENFGELLLDSEAYKKHQQLFFKNPSHFKIQRQKLVFGYNEINELLKTYMMPNNFDLMFFESHIRSDNEFSMLTYNHRVQDIMDHNFMVINKVKHFGGLLLGFQMQFLEILKLRFNLPHDVFADSFWIGLELSGTGETVHFNQHFGSVPGFLTPADNKNYDKMTTSNELCSASWCQIDERDDYSILYVTTHQLENYMNHEAFESDLKTKYKVTESKKQLDHPFLIENVMRPPTLLQLVHVPEFREPKSAWVRDRSFGKGRGHPFWCGYDVIGSPDSGIRGLVFDYGKTLQERFKFIFDLWLN